MFFDLVIVVIFVIIIVIRRSNIVISNIVSYDDYMKSNLWVYMVFCMVNNWVIRVLL